MTQLNEADCAAVRALVTACNAADGSNYDPEAVLDADFFYLVRNTEKEESGCDADIISMLSGLRLGETLNGDALLEIQAFTHPALRQLGFFSLCYNSLRDDFRRFAFKFMTKGDASAETLRAIHADFQCEERMMQKTLARGISNPDDTLCTKQGEVYLIPFSADTLYLHALLVYDSWRGQGYGEQLMRAVEACPDGPYTNILLQVAGDNIPAVSLYEKLGYELVDCIRYYTVPGQ